VGISDAYKVDQSTLCHVPPPLRRNHFGLPGSM
jgi:hypothetical protein